MSKNFWNLNVLTVCTLGTCIQAIEAQNATVALRLVYRMYLKGSVKEQRNFEKSDFSKNAENATNVVKENVLQCLHKSTKFW